MLLFIYIHKHYRALEFMKKSNFNTLIFKIDSNFKQTNNNCDCSTSPTCSDRSRTRNLRDKLELLKLKDFVKHNFDAINKRIHNLKSSSKSNFDLSDSSYNKNSDQSSSLKNLNNTDSDSTSIKPIRMTAQMASFLKLTLVGDGGVGKSCLILQYMYGDVSLFLVYI